MTKAASNKLSKEYKGPMLGAATKGYDVGVEGKSDRNCPYKVDKNASGRGSGMVGTFKKSWMAGWTIGHAEFENSGNAKPTPAPSTETAAE